VGYSARRASSGDGIEARAIGIAAREKASSFGSMSGVSYPHLSVRLSRRKQPNKNAWVNLI
jgi:hypothetical protein